MYSFSCRFSMTSFTQCLSSKKDKFPLLMLLCTVCTLNTFSNIQVFSEFMTPAKRVVAQCISSAHWSVLLLTLDTTLICLIRSCQSVFLERSIKNGKTCKSSEHTEKNRHTNKITTQWRAAHFAQKLQGEKNLFKKLKWWRWNRFILARGIFVSIYAAQSCSCWIS